MGFKRNGGLIDRTVLVAANGATLELHGVSRRYALTEEDYGMPPIEYVSQRGIFQDGESVLAQYLRPRPVQLVVRWSACSRVEYWNNRGTLLEFVRPARSAGTLSLRKYLANGKVRQLDIVPDASPAFGPRNLGQWDEFAFSEALKFIAHNPTWYDPTRKTITSGALSPTTSLAYFIEDWPGSSIDATKWADSSGAGETNTVAGGHLTVAFPTSGYSILGTPTPPTAYTMRNSYWVFEVVIPPAHVLGGFECDIAISDSGGTSTWDRLTVFTDGSSGSRKLHATIHTGGSDVAFCPDFLFDPVTMKYIGFTFEAARVRLWTSPDSVTWTMRGENTAVVTSAVAVCQSYALDGWASNFVSDSVVFGPVNNVSVAPGGISVGALAVAIPYLGTWREFPIITIDGPVTDPVITNSSTGETLTFTGGLVVADGKTLIIDLTYGQKSALLSSGGGSALGYLDAASDLVSFHLAPAPEVTGGVNHIALTGTSMGANTAIDVAWYDRFVGI